MSDEAGAQAGGNEPAGVSSHKAVVEALAEALAEAGVGSISLAGAITGAQSTPRALPARLCGGGGGM